MANRLKKWQKLAAKALLFGTLYGVVKFAMSGDGVDAIKRAVLVAFIFFVITAFFTLFEKDK